MRSPVRDWRCLVELSLLWAGPQAVDPAGAKPDTYLSGVVTELTRQWPANRTVNIVCHGHSVPAGYFRTPVVDTFNAYPHLLHRGLKERFPYAVVNVIVTAIGGENSESGANAVRARCAVAAAGCGHDRLRPE